MIERDSDRLDDKLIKDMEWEGCPNFKKTIRIFDLNATTGVLTTMIAEVDSLQGKNK